MFHIEVFFASGMDQTSGQEPDAITIDHTTDDTTTTQTTDAVAITTDTIDHTDDVICTFRSSISSITPPIVISVIAVVTAIVEFIAIVLLLLGRRSPKDKHEVASSLGEEEEAGYEEVDDHMYMEIDAGEKNMLDFQSDEAISSPSSLQQNRVYFKVQEDAVQRGRETTV